ncbi:MAG TPA: DUF2505 domain-containing protein [Myxococcota bacterium]|nr:DUF2505 domain-containing protein [Myxococcota bacterium]
MRFRVEHTFSGISLQAYETLFFDEPFNIALCQAVKLARTLESRTLDSGRLRRATRIGPEREIPAPVPKVLGTTKFEYTEHIDYTMGSFKGTWKTVPAMMADKVESAGTFSFVARGNDVTRIVEGDVKVKIFGLGAVIERFVVADVERSYDAAADFTRQWIAKGGR